MRRLFPLLIAFALLLNTTDLALAAPAAGPTDAGELEAFLEPIFARQMQERRIPGAVFVLVKDGRILFTKGYGLANVEQGTPVRPDRTLFAIGSITKLFTATAAMQLAEQGKLDLHADVNRYLKEVQVPATYPEPITTAQLLTHTAGLDEVTFGIAARPPAEAEPLGQYLARSLPPRVRPPGLESQYSNHGFALVGHLVEEISGRSYSQYITDEILRPLGMSRTTLEMPADLLPDISPVNGYIGNPPARQPDWVMQVAPAGDLKATATDMAAFLIAHLQNGQYLDRRILGEETAREMHRQQFTHHPGVQGIAFGFMERLRNGHRAIEHGGDTLGTSSLLTLLPEQGWGFFVSYNSPAGNLSADELADALMDRYAPGPAAPPTPLAAEVARYAGEYRLNRYPHQTFAKLQGLIMSASVRDNGDGSLTLHYPVNMRPPLRILPVAPNLFRSEDGQKAVAFKTDETGQVSRLYLPMAVFAAERLAWYESTLLHLGLLAGVALLALSALVAWPAGAWRRRRRDLAPLPPKAATARWIGGTVSALILAFLTGLSVFMATALQRAVFGLPLWVYPVLVTPLLAAALTLPLVWATVRACRIPGWSPAGKLHLSLLTLGCLLFIPFLLYWDLLSLPS